MKKGPEGRLQKEVLEYMETTGLMYWRQNSGTMFVAGRCIKLGVKGSPDIVALHPKTGQYVGIELKAFKGKLTDDQEDFCERLRKTGAQYHVARSLDEVKTIVTHLRFDFAQLVTDHLASLKE